MRSSDAFPPPWRSSTSPQYNARAAEAVTSWTSWKGKLPIYKQTALIEPKAVNDSHEKDREDQSSLESWLTRFPNLQFLHIGCFDLAIHSSLNQEGSTKAFSQAVRAISFPKLSTLSVENISLLTGEVKQLLRRHRQLRKVMFEDLHLEDPENFNEFVNWLEGVDNPVQGLCVITVWTPHSNTLFDLRLEKDLPKGTNQRTVIGRGSERNGEYKRQHFGPPWRLD